MLKRKQVSRISETGFQHKEWGSDTVLGQGLFNTFINDLNEGVGLDPQQVCS